MLVRLARLDDGTGRASYLGNNEAGCLLSSDGGIDEVELSDDVEETEDVEAERSMQDASIFESRVDDRNASRSSSREGRVTLPWSRAGRPRKDERTKPNPAAGDSRRDGYRVTNWASFARGWR